MCENKTVAPPKYAFTCRHPLEFYRLLKGKRLFIPDNIEIREGMEYYVYSEYKGGYYRRTVEGHRNYMKDYFYEITQGYILIVYPPEEANDIKQHMKRE